MFLWNTALPGKIDVGDYRIYPYHSHMSISYYKILNKSILPVDLSENY